MTSTTNVGLVFKTRKSLNFLTVYVTTGYRDTPSGFHNVEFGFELLKPAWATWRQYLFDYQHTKKTFWTKGDIMVCGFFIRWFGGHD